MAKSLPKIGDRPTEVTPDAWINGGTTTPQNQKNRKTEISNQEEPTSRLTLDIPRSLHTEIKAQCARRGTKMVSEITDLLYAHYSPDIQK
ncbi:hypothetical protein [Mycobacteroides abscessus]|uniref:hypothetical protein n=1 Tax=Mycobacteroides abscessus TaxID=36809 RepID=UPI0019CFEBE5|nr:hypothetical protein [Mycobacteroides abscessus]MBN7314889.1 hypothetical protein [Mycobacteroides abscessus subsp. abscessus]